MHQSPPLLSLLTHRLGTGSFKGLLLWVMPACLSSHSPQHSSVTLLVWGIMPQNEKEPWGTESRKQWVHVQYRIRITETKGFIYLFIYCLFFFIVKLMPSTEVLVLGASVDETLWKMYKDPDFVRWLTSLVVFPEVPTELDLTALT